MRISKFSHSLLHSKTLIAKVHGINKLAAYALSSFTPAFITFLNDKVLTLPNVRRGTEITIDKDSIFGNVYLLYKLSNEKILSKAILLAKQLGNEINLNKDEDKYVLKSIEDAIRNSILNYIQEYIENLIETNKSFSDLGEIVDNTLYQDVRNKGEEQIAEEIFESDRELIEDIIKKYRLKKTISDQEILDNKDEIVEEMLDRLKKEFGEMDLQAFIEIFVLMMEGHKVSEIMKYKDWIVPKKVPGAKSSGPSGPTRPPLPHGNIPASA